MQVYLDNAATTPIGSTVLDVMVEVMKNDYGNPSSIHSKGRKAKSLLEGARKRVAEILQASTGEIFFTSSATEANNMALFCSVRDLGIKRIVSSPTEHPCVLNSIIHLQQVFGTQVDFVRVDGLGNPDLEHLEDLLEENDHTLVSLMHGNNEMGTMIDIQAVSELCHQKQVLFHCDSVQTIGKNKMDLSKLNVSFLSASGHKIYGPKGVGMIYINNDNRIQAMIKGGGQERDVRSGTENLYGIVGFAEALGWLDIHRDECREKILSLRDHFKSKLKQLLPEVQFIGNQETLFLPHILSTSFPKNDKTELAMFNLDIHGICASAGSACSSGAEQSSHVITAMGIPADRKAIRFSFSHKNTIEELDYTIEKLGDIMTTS